MNKNLLAVITQALLYVLAAFVLFCIASIFTLEYVAAYFEEFYGMGETRLLFYGFLLLAGLVALWILFELMFVMQTVSKDPFVERNVFAFVRMGAAAEVAGALFIAKCFIFFTPMTAVCAVVMLLAGLFALVLAGVFRKAVAFKRENDLTI